MRASELYLRRVVFVVIAAASVFVCAATARAQVDRWGYWENGVSEPWWFSATDFTERDASAVVARWKAIGGGAASADAWAGDYFVGGSTHGTYLRWSPEGGFVIAHINKCAAQAVGVVHGRAELTPTVIRFVPEFRAGASSAHRHGAHEHAAAPPAELRFVPVAWRGERFLVPEDEMADFGDYAAGLGKYNDAGVFGFFDFTLFMTQFGVPEGRAAAGVEASAPPSVPAGYERFVKRAIEASVTAVGRSRDARDYTDEGTHSGVTYKRARLTFVTVNVGSEHGVAAGMQFRVREPAEGDTVKIVRAGKSISEAVVVRIVDEDGRVTFYDHAAEQERPRSRVRAGWKLTTLLY